MANCADLHARFDQWLDRLEEQVPDPQTSLAEVTEAVWKLRQDLTGGLSERLWSRPIGANGAVSIPAVLSVGGA